MDLIGRVEARRRELRLTQASVALSCGVTQGYMSKILNRRFHPGAETEQRLTAWLQAAAAAGGEASTTTGEIDSVTSAIEQHCVELMNLVRRLRR